MKIISNNETVIIKNSDKCTALEFPLGDKDINGAVIILKGRYPDEGRTVNTKCKEMAYIIKGKGNIFVNNKKTKFNKGDLILIYPNEEYYWEGNAEMFVPCTPAWFPEQHKIFK